MTSESIRDPLADHLITPQNSAFLLIDWQPTQISTVRSADHDLLLRNAVSTVRTVKAYGVPVVHSTVNVASGQQQPTVPEIAELVQDDEPLDLDLLDLPPAARWREWMLRVEAAIFASDRPVPFGFFNGESRNTSSGPMNNYTSPFSPARCNAIDR